MSSAVPTPAWVTYTPPPLPTLYTFTPQFLPWFSTNNTGWSNPAFVAFTDIKLLFAVAPTVEYTSRPVFVPAWFRNIPSPLPALYRLIPVFVPWFSRYNTD